MDSKIEGMLASSPHSLEVANLEVNSWTKG